MIQPKPRDRRASIRFDKVFKVTVQTEGYGEMQAVARNISEGGMMIETPMPFPLGTELTVAFEMPDSHSTISARAEVKNHYAFNYSESGEPRSARGIGIRFVEFREPAERSGRTDVPPPPTRARTLH
jgi:hypothetical protein